MSDGSSILSLRELEEFDPHAPERGRNRPFCCPLGGVCEGKPKDATHRSLRVDTETGLWTCHRCQKRGKLREHWRDRERPAYQSPREQARAACRRAFYVPAARSTSADPPDPEPRAEGGTWRRRWEAAVPLAGTDGARYLESRGIPVEIAAAADVRYAPAWEHWERTAGGTWRKAGVSRRVVFPVRDPGGELVAIQGRVIDDNEREPRVDTRGEPERGVFATPGAWQAPIVTICEAPADGLSLALAGLPALATLGCDLRDWLPRTLAFRRAAVALDADEPGEKAAAQWIPVLRGDGVDARRLRPVGAKDWNEALQADAAGLRAHLRTWERSALSALLMQSGEPYPTPDDVMEQARDRFYPAVTISGHEIAETHAAWATFTGRATVAELLAAVARFETIRD